MTRSHHPLAPSAVAFTACVTFLSACGGAQSTASSEPGSEAASGSGSGAGLATRDLYLGADEPESRAILAEGFLDVRVMQVMSDGVERPVSPGAVMRAGDRFYLRLTTREEAHVYVMYVGPDQVTHLLLPDGDDELVTPAGTTTRVPATGRTIQLDGETGLEQLYVVASRRSLSELGDDTLAAVNAARVGDRPPAVEVSGPTPAQVARAEREGEPSDERRSMGFAGASVRTRGLGVVADAPDSGAAGGSRIVASADEAGVAVVLFPIDHR